MSRHFPFTGVFIKFQAGGSKLSIGGSIFAFLGVNFRVLGSKMSRHFPFTGVFIKFQSRGSKFSINFDFGGRFLPFYRFLTTFSIKSS